jgi:hypothetical protein
MASPAKQLINKNVYMFHGGYIGRDRETSKSSTSTARFKLFSSSKK